VPRTERARSGYGVTLVRGPSVQLKPHKRGYATTDDLVDDIESFSRPLAADIFCGAGGLSLGLQAAGFDVVVGVDHDPLALETHRNLFPGVALDRDLADPEAVEEIIDLLTACDVRLIAGGPPCQPFSRAGSSKIRSLVEEGVREAHDRRRDLWESWLDIVLGVMPPAVLLENVPEMAIGGDMEIIRTLVAALEGEGYAVHTKVLKAVEHGVPQFRQRLFLVALADGGGVTWPKPVQKQVNVGDAISDLPPVEGGWRSPDGAHGYLTYVKPAEPHPFVARARAGMTGQLAQRVYDHITRPVRDDDKAIFEQMDSKTKYSDLDDGPHKRYRDDIFDDKYKRLGLDEPSRSITAHIAKDGYWYIHPTQLRTLTIREAARIQTFPDRVRFSGPPSAAFRQIGNAVPPLLSEKVGCRILKATKSKLPSGPATADVADLLANWFIARDELTLPWLDAGHPWQVIAAELLVGRASPVVSREAWTSLEKHETPERTIELKDELLDLGDLIGRSERVPRMLAAAEWYVADSTMLDDTEQMARNPHVTRPIAQLAALVAGTTAVGPVLATAPVLRVAARFSGEPVDQVDKGSAGRMIIARMIGGSLLDGDAMESRYAQAALVELGQGVCRPAAPRCDECPLVDLCSCPPRKRRRVTAPRR
jgi:DNA (cytosine-5)-methyltransferase 1